MPITCYRPDAVAADRVADAWFDASSDRRRARARIAQIDRETMLEALALAADTIAEAMRRSERSGAGLDELLRQSREYIEVACEAGGGERSDLCRSLAWLAERTAGAA